jgi:hypothetical protein
MPLQEARVIDEEEGRMMDRFEVPVAQAELLEASSGGDDESTHECGTPHSGRKRARCYEVFQIDASDDSYCVCQTGA